MSQRAETKQRERRFVVEFVKTKWPSNTSLFNYRLGGIPAKLQGVDIGDLSPNIYKVFQRYVDAIVFLPDRLILVEAKILADIGAVSQLEYYAALVSQTPDLAQYAKLPLELRIVTASADPSFVNFANEHKIIIDIFRPLWAVDYLNELIRKT